MSLDLARGLVASFAADLVKDRLRVPIVGFIVVAVVLFGMALAVRGGAGIGIFVVGLIALGMAGLFVAIRWVALFGVRRLGPAVPDHEDRVAEFFAAADLPTGPISVVRLLNRLRKGGADDELDRLRKVLDDLSGEFGNAE